MHISISTHYALLITIFVTTICWLATAFLAPATSRDTLIEFYKKVRPFGPGWRRIRVEAGLPESDRPGEHENIPLALLGWSAGCAMIWSSLFTVGNVLYGRWPQAGLLFAVFVTSGLLLLFVINRLWRMAP